MSPDDFYSFVYKGFIHLIIHQDTMCGFWLSREFFLHHDPAVYQIITT